MKKTAVVILVLLAGAMTAAAGEVAFVDTYAHAKQMAAEQNKNMEAAQAIRVLATAKSAAAPEAQTKPGTSSQ